MCIYVFVRKKGNQVRLSQNYRISIATHDYFYFKPGCTNVGFTTNYNNINIIEYYKYYRIYYTMCREMRFLSWSRRRFPQTVVSRWKLLLLAIIFKWIIMHLIFSNVGILDSWRKATARSLFVKPSSVQRRFDRRQKKNDGIRRERKRRQRYSTALI